MGLRQLLFYIIGAFLCFHSPQIRALDSVNVLPKGINSLSIKAGAIRGLNQFYSSSGRLEYLSQLNSIEFDTATLVSIQPDVQNLVNILNQFGHFAVGDNVHLGQLTIDADPNVNYLAPIYLRALSSRWTVGLALPIIFYENNVQLSHRGSNIGQLRSEFGGLSAELDNAFDRLDVNMRAEVNRFIGERGYKPLGRTETTFIGDVQLISLWQFYNNKKTRLALQSLVGLPTGPEGDPDDLTDLEMFSRTSISEKIILERKLDKKLSFISTLGYVYYLPDSADKRVPKDASDTLPDKNQTENVDRQIGGVASLLGGALYDFNDSFQVIGAVNYEVKSEDSYSGSRGLSYSELSKKSESNSTALKFQASYSGVNDYFNKKAIMPYTISYELSSVVAGNNVENQTSHEVWLKVFF